MQFRFKTESKGMALALTFFGMLVAFSIGQDSPIQIQRQKRQGAQGPESQCCG